MTVVYAGLFVAVGLIIDWAMFERIMTSGEVLWSVRPGYRYQATLFPRILLTTISSTIFGFAAVAEVQSNTLTIAGAIGFAASLIYALIATTTRQRRAEAAMRGNGS